MKAIMQLSLEGKKNAEIADRLNISTETVHTLKKIAYKMCIRDRSKSETGKEHLERNDFIIEKQRAELQRMDAAKRHKEGPHLSQFLPPHEMVLGARWTSGRVVWPPTYTLRSEVVHQILAAPIPVATGVLRSLLQVLLRLLR